MSEELNERVTLTVEELEAIKATSAGDPFSHTGGFVKLKRDNEISAAVFQAAIDEAVANPPIVEDPPFLKAKKKKGKAGEYAQCAASDCCDKPGSCTRCVKIEDAAKNLIESYKSRHTELRLPGLKELIAAIES